MRPLAFVLGFSLALSGLNVRSEPTPYVAIVQNASLQEVAESEKGAVHQIVTPEAGTSCTGVARSASVVMYAEHCLRGVVPTVLQIDHSYQVEIDHIARDGNDHVLMSVKGAPFKQWASMATERPKQGDWVFIYGAPGRFGDLLRFGTYAGHETSYWEIGDDWIVYDLRTDHGDSGGAIFNGRGEVVDMVYGSPLEMQWLTLCFPIAFTRAQELWVGL